jgi:hypothetical protein
MALEAVEGPLLGPRRDDLRAGVIAATVANVNRGRRDKASSPEDFVLRFEAPREEDPQDAEDALRRLGK